MLRDGHFKIHRATFSHPIVGIARPLRFALWQWMIGEAFFTESGAKSLKRGQFAATNRQLADVVGMPLGTFKTFKAELVEAGMVSVSRPTSARAPSVWTVENYDEYQSKTPNPSPNPSIAINPTPGIQVAMGVPDGSETTTQPIAQPIDSHPYKENSRTKTKEIPPNPPGGDAGASGGDEEDSEPVKDSTGTVWPKPKPGRMKYPDGFEKIWEVWKRAQKAAPKAVKAAGKANAYELCRGHLSRGSTPEEMRSAAIKYLLPFTNKTETVGCFQPSRFYRASGAEFFEYLDTEGDLGPAPMRERWHNPRDAWRECALLANHLGVKIPEVPKRAYGAEWEDVEAFHSLVIQYATDRAGFKTMPDDLAQQVRGSE